LQGEIPALEGILSWGGNPQGKKSLYYVYAPVNKVVLENALPAFVRVQPGGRGGRHQAFLSQATFQGRLMPRMRNFEEGEGGGLRQKRGLFFRGRSQQLRKISKWDVLLSPP